MARCCHVVTSWSLIRRKKRKKHQRASEENRREGSPRARGCRAPEWRRTLSDSHFERGRVCVVTSGLWLARETRLKEQVRKKKKVRERERELSE